MKTIKSIIAGCYLRLPHNANKIIFLTGAGFCLFPVITAPIALIMGLVYAQILKHPFPVYNHKATNFLLKISVVGLGFGMNITTALHAGKTGFFLTIGSILLVLVVGYLSGKLLKTDSKTSFLISAGTAICGGSAIAALSPAINAKEKQISVALGIVFVLNSVALFAFPVIGHAFNLSQTQFGMWCAIAIHDTSSVVGAASRYGAQALEIATTVKLARALWIVPLTFLSVLLFKGNRSKIQMPYFIGLFILALLANTYISSVHFLAPYVVYLSKIGLTLTLFLIGSDLSFSVLKNVGFKPLVQGLILWIMISIVSLWVVICLV
ncbi:YeiH family protein [Pedobacter punctiformis]|uniref:Sulfate exporter family transporter n=1 Tax=Pedobacter punctiformis TaxID=3004097 RepID=A0ABT4LB24_9SPHI|nr:putative sulfate exporter family transporter [Pedobacter sp. HCMS5-2]MCZ4245105.1 putative sulfate exporter family transporter [Pedobacter sp. HCMS5-2]